MEVDPSSSTTNPNTPASEFLRGKAKALDALHRKVKAAPGDEDVLITASTEMGMIFDRFIKGHADENAIVFNSAAEAVAYIEAIGFLGRHASGKFVSIVVGVECYAAAE